MKVPQMQDVEMQIGVKGEEIPSRRPVIYIPTC